MGKGERRRARKKAEEAAREQELADRDAVREDVGYRSAVDRPRPKPPAPERPAPPESKKEPGLEEYNKAGTLFLVLGALLVVGMSAIAYGSVRDDKNAHRAQTTFVRQSCKILESRDQSTEGGGTEHVVAFESTRSGRTYRHDRYSPDSDAHGPGARWLPVGQISDCWCAPDDPRECYLSQGKRENRESVPWAFVLLIPLIFLGIGAAMRGAKRLPEDD